MSINILL